MINTCHTCKYETIPGFRAPCKDCNVYDKWVPKEQPTPVPNDKPAIWPLVIVDMNARDNLGRQRYGTPLQPDNGRDMLKDAYEEALDLACYLRGALYERDGS